MVKPQQKGRQTIGKPEQKGAIFIDDTAWEALTEEELMQLLKETVAAAPRDIVYDWLINTLLPMLEHHLEKGVGS